MNLPDNERAVTGDYILSDGPHWKELAVVLPFGTRALISWPVSPLAKPQGTKLYALTDHTATWGPRPVKERGLRYVLCAEQPETHDRLVAWHAAVTLSGEPCFEMIEDLFDMEEMIHDPCD